MTPLFWGEKDYPATWKFFRDTLPNAKEQLGSADQWGSFYSFFNELTGQPSTQFYTALQWQTLPYISVGTSFGVPSPTIVQVTSDYFQLFEDRRTQKTEMFEFALTLIVGWGAKNGGRDPVKAMGAFWFPTKANLKKRKGLAAIPGFNPGMQFSDFK